MMNDPLFWKGPKRACASKPEMTMISRRRFGSTALAGALGVAAGAMSGLVLPRSAQAAAEPTLNEAGLHTQPWFLDSFLELKDDFEEARAKGKRFAVIWELKGCPYCREMHLVNFARPGIADYIKANFEILQLDKAGVRGATDFDGSKMGERELARKYRVAFTPTIQFFPETLADMSGKTGQAREATRMAGYIQPFYFVSMFRYVRESAYKRQDFRAYMKANLKRLQKEFS